MKQVEIEIQLSSGKTTYAFFDVYHCEKGEMYLLNDIDYTDLDLSEMLEAEQKALPNLNAFLDRVSKLAEGLV